MEWNLEEALAYYRGQGAPSDQTMLVGLLKEIQKEQGGLSPAAVKQIAEAYGIKETFLLAIVRRYPSLRLQDTHCLEICCGPNCPRRKDLAAFVEKTCGKTPAGFTVRHVGCMRMCGKGPNIRWDGQIYHGADESLIRRLTEEK